MSVAMIVGPVASKKKKPEVEKILKNMTHLHLENRKIEIIGNLDTCMGL